MNIYLKSYLLSIGYYGRHFDSVQNLKVKRTTPFTNMKPNQSLKPNPFVSAQGREIVQTMNSDPGLAVGESRR